MRRKKHTEKEVHAHLISVVSVRLREGYTIRDISLTKGKCLSLSFTLQKVQRQSFQQCGECCSFIENEASPFLRWDSAGGKVGFAVETQHAYWVPSSCLLATGSLQKNHQGGGNDGGKLRHSSWHQLHPEEAHYQPIPHLCHPPLLEHTSEVLHVCQERGNVEDFNAG